MLFFTGLSRTASDIACDKIKNIPNNNKNLSRMKELVDDAYKIIINPKRNLSEFGDLMNETWELKKRLSEKVSTSDIEKMYSTAIENGAIGGKLCGAGGGGFMLLYVLPRDQQRVKEALKGYLHVPFKFDFDGSKIIVYKPS
jgi:D-glycero-alpha-D-manno-heptose-7-phosphate kinase